VLDVIYIGLVVWANKHGGHLPLSFREQFDTSNGEYRLIGSGGEFEMRNDSSQPVEP
jgi:hypothetical protein